jgi:hypothetical protein
MHLSTASLLTQHSCEPVIDVLAKAVIDISQPTARQDFKSASLNFDSASRGARGLGETYELFSQ